MSRISHLTFDIDNLRVSVTLSGGFLGLNTSLTNLKTHCHKDYELHFLFNGCAILQTELGAFNLRETDICIIAPNIVHSNIQSDPKTTKTNFCFSFRKIKTKSETDIFTLLADSIGSIETIKIIKRKKSYINILKTIISEFYSEKTFAEHRMKFYFSLFLLGIAEDLLPKKTNQSTIKDRIINDTDDMRCIIIEEYINQNYNKDITLSALAEILYLTKKQTSIIIQREFGMTFKQYVFKLRLNSATHLLCNTDLPLDVIAQKTGYQSYNGFYNMFISHTGKNPEKFRQENKL